MSKVRVLVGTRKGAFILTSDGKRENWDVSGPHFAGWEIYHLKGSPADPEPHLRLADQRMVRPDHPALRRWRQDLASARHASRRTHRARAACPKARATSSSTTHRLKPASRSPRISGTTARSIPGSSSASGISSPRSPIPTRSTPASKTRRCFSSTDGGKNWKELSGLRGHGTGPKWQPGAGGMCLHTIILDPSNPQPHLHRDLGRGRVPHRRRRQDLEADQQGPVFEVHSRPDGRGRTLRSPHRHESKASGRALHAEALGRDALRQCRRSVDEDQRQSADRFRLRDRRARARTGDDLRRPHQERRRALSSTTASCASSAADRRQRVGSPSPKACRKRIATSTCCAMPWPSIRSTSAAFTSAPPAARSTSRPMAATPGQPIVRDLPAVLSVEVQTLA